MRSVNFISDIEMIAFSFDILSKTNDDGVHM